MSIFDIIAPNFYFRLDRNKLSVRQIGSPITFETKTHAYWVNGQVVAIGEDNLKIPEKHEIRDGFGHERVLIGDFECAEIVLKYVIRRLQRFRFYFRPIAIVQIKRKLEGGITDVERRSVIDCFESAGAREVILWTGNEFSEMELSDWNTLKQTIKNKERSDELSKMQR